MSDHNNKNAEKNKDLVNGATNYMADYGCNLIRCFWGFPVGEMAENYILFLFGMMTCWWLSRGFYGDDMHYVKCDHTASRYTCSRAGCRFADMDDLNCMGMVAAPFNATWIHAGKMNFQQFKEVELIHMGIFEAEDALCGCDPPWDDVDVHPLSVGMVANSL